MANEKIFPPKRPQSAPAHGNANSFFLSPFYSDFLEHRSTERHTFSQLASDHRLELLASPSIVTACYDAHDSTKEANQVAHCGCSCESAHHSGKGKAEVRSMQQLMGHGRIQAGGSYSGRSSLVHALVTQPPSLGSRERQPVAPLAGCTVASVPVDLLDQIAQISLHVESIGLRSPNETPPQEARYSTDPQAFQHQAFIPPAPGGNWPNAASRMLDSSQLCAPPSIAECPFATPNTLSAMHSDCATDETAFRQTALPHSSDGHQQQLHTEHAQEGSHIQGSHVTRADFVSRGMNLPQGWQLAQAPGTCDDAVSYQALSTGERMVNMGACRDSISCEIVDMMNNRHGFEQGVTSRQAIERQTHVQELACQQPTEGRSELRVTRTTNNYGSYASDGEHQLLQTRAQSPCLKSRALEGQHMGCPTESMQRPRHHATGADNTLLTAAPSATHLDQRTMYPVSTSSLELIARASAFRDCSRSHHVLGNHHRASHEVRNRRRDGNSDSIYLSRSGDCSSEPVCSRKVLACKGREVRTVEEAAALDGGLLELAHDQNGCRFLQDQVDRRSRTHIDEIFTAVLPDVVSLSTDPFGNYLIQKLVQHGSVEQRTSLVCGIAPSLFSLALNVHGTRVVQKVIEIADTPQQVDMVVAAMDGRVLELMLDMNGNHVVQRCLCTLSPDRAEFVYAAACNETLRISTHRHGCCVMQRCLDFALEARRQIIVANIIRHVKELVLDPFGNYVVQYVLKLKRPSIVREIAQALSGSFAELSLQKFSSNVIEKCLQGGNREVIAMVNHEIASAQDFAQLLHDPFANYVVQTLLTLGNDDEVRFLKEKLQPHMQKLRATLCGKRILQRLRSRTKVSG